MAQYNLLDTDTVTLNEILKSGNYKVPDFQRDYSWKEEEWEDLWDDIITIKDANKPVHYMGAIVLQDLNNKTLAVIDGQQRLATLSIIALAIIKNIQVLVDNGIEVEENKERIKDLIATYIGKKDAVSRHYSNKLELNENDDWFYSETLVHWQKPINLKKLHKSNQLLYHASEFFDQKIQNLFTSDASGENLADFLQNKIAEKLAFIQIVVKDDLDAYIVFETLNSRGVELGTSDLLKNYLFSLTAKSDKDKNLAKEQWKRITRTINLSDFPVFLRFYWASQHRTVRKEQLYKELRNSVKDKSRAFNLLRKLEEHAEVYSALKNPQDDFWKGKPLIQKHIEELNLFGIRQPFPLLMTTYNHLSLLDFETILRYCTIIGFRYNIIGGLDPKKQEGVFHETARKISKGELTKVSQIVKELKPIYPTDEEFINSFKTKQLNRKKSNLIKYILCAIECQLSGREIDFRTDNGTIEHILPENAKAIWNKYIPKSEQENYVYRLGNLTLLEKKKNDECGNDFFDKKTIVYKSSQYKMTYSIDDKEWKTKEIRERQAKLAKTAKSVWKISQLSN